MPARLPAFSPLSPQTLINISQVLAPSVSALGDQVAFYANFDERFEIYVQHLRTGERRQLTFGQAADTPRSALHWSKDGTHLYFSRDEQGDERQAIYEIRLSDGHIRPLEHAPHSMDYVADLHPAGQMLLANSTQGGQMNVYCYDLASDVAEVAKNGHNTNADTRTEKQTSAWTPLTQQPNTTMADQYSPNGEWVSVQSNESNNLKNQDIYLMRADGSDWRKIWSVQEGSTESVHDWHPQGQMLAVSSDAAGHVRAGLLRLTADYSQAQVQWLTPEDERLEEYPACFSPDGQWLCVVRGHDSLLSPVLYEVATGKERLLQMPQGLNYHLHFVLGGQGLLMLHTSSTVPAELWLYNLSSDQARPIVQPEYGDLDPSEFVSAEYVWYPSTDGVQVPALLYRPKQATLPAPDPSAPALLCVHGGPTDQFFRCFEPQMQLLASHGYTVLCPNIRGSTGYGVSWRDANLHDWGGRDLQDVLAGAQYLASLPHVDPKRLGIFGVSFGGYMSYLAAVKHPDTFKVSVPIVGISDLQQLHADNARDMPQLAYYFCSMMGDPEAQAQLWQDRSAIHFAQQLKAHMLMVHGANDPRCPLNQATRFRDQLLQCGREEGKDFELVIFEDAGHGRYDKKGRLATDTLLLDYLRRKL